MAREYDVVLESFRPGGMRRLGIGYHKAKKVNEIIIIVPLPVMVNLDWKRKKLVMILIIWLRVAFCIPQVADLAAGRCFNAMLVAYVAVQCGETGAPPLIYL